MQIVLANASIIDAEHGARSGNVLVEDGFIKDLNSSTSGADNRRIIDLKGRSLVPGFIDCHVHTVVSQVNLNANAQLPDALAVLRSVPILEGMLDRGFTTVRDVGGAPFALAQAIAEGLVKGPRLFVCGKALSKTGGHMDVRLRHDTFGPNRWRNNFGAMGRVADGVDEVVKACRQELRSGVSFIKINANGGISGTTDPVDWQGYSVAEMEAAVSEAADSKTYVAAHLYTADGIERAINAGVHSLEHCNMITPRVASLAAKAGSVSVPTLSIFEALAAEGAQLGLSAEAIGKIDGIRNAGLGSLQILADAGVPMAYGTDLLGPLHERQNQEFLLRSEVLPAKTIFAAATTVGAELIGMKGKLGVIAPGAIADLLVVDCNPLEDVKPLASPGRSVKMVMKEGKVHRCNLDD